jgi:hypothetical protein
MAPANSVTSAETYVPYSDDLFSRPKAQFVAVSTRDTMLTRVLQQASPQQLSALAQQALAKLPVVKRRNQGITHIGFFNQGLFTGGVLLLSTVLGVTGVCSYYGIGLLRSRVFSAL